MLEYLKKASGLIRYSQSSELKRIFRIYSNGTLKYLSSSPEQLSVSDFHRVLILSPHPDDDVIGAGGTIAKCVRENVQVKVVYLTSGNKRNLDESPPSSIRGIEAMEGLKVLGCKDFQFLNYYDKELILKSNAWRDILEILEEYRPDAIFTPSFLDKHVDHYATSLILARALEKSDLKATCYCYEIWMPAIVNSYIDISSVVDMKVEAINKHVSQIQSYNYSDKIISLNRYRSLYNVNGSTHCEAFWQCSAKEFIKIKKLSESYLK